MAQPFITLYTVKNITGTSATVHAGADPLDLPSISVRVQYRIVGQSTWNDTPPVTVTYGVLLDFDLHNLTPSSTYEARVVATWSGQSLHTEPRTFNTTYTAIEPAVWTLTVNASSNHIKIVAQVMGDPRDWTSAKMYVQYRILGTATWIDTVKTTIYKETTYDYHLEYLQPNTTYEVRGAIGFNGQAKYGQIKTAKTISEPSWQHPTLAVFSPPEEVLKNSALIKVSVNPGDYLEVWVRIEYRAPGQDWQQTSSTSFKSLSTGYFRLNNLTPSTRYEYRGRLNYDFIITSPIYSFVTKGEQVEPPPPNGEPPPDEELGGIPWYVWAIGGVAVAIVMAVALRRK